MSDPALARLLADGWVEEIAADDAEVLGFWRRAVESYEDATVARLSRRGQFKLLYDAARQGVVTLLASHGYRARGATAHHQRTFAAGVALAPEALRPSIAGMQTHRGLRHEVEYSAHGEVSEPEVTRMRATVCELLNGLADEIRRLRPEIKRSVRKLRCPT